MSDLTITEFDPQSSDSERMLLARLLAYQQRACVRGTFLASAARTATTSSSAFDGHLYRGLVIWLNITAASGTGGLRPTVDYLDPISGSWRGLVALNSAAITAAGTTPFGLGPGFAGGIGFAINAGGLVAVPLSSQMRISVGHTDASSYTYSLGYELIP